MTGRHVVVARQDNAGDVVLLGPAIRAIASTASTERITMVCAPQGEPAARLLPAVDHVVVHAAPWIDAHPCCPDRATEMAFVDAVAASGIDEAIVFTSFHQSPLPTALLLRLAGIDRIGAISVDYPGSLLDVRHAVDDGVHEVERSLSLAAAMGHALPADDDARLRLVDLPPAAGVPPEPYVVVHPGASVPARAWSPERLRATAESLHAAGWRVVVTGGPGERDLCAYVAGRLGLDLSGATDLAGLAAIVRDAAALVVGNTGPAHVAAAVATPVVSLFAPTLPPVRWRPWKVPHVVLGDHGISCAGCRARACPFADGGVQPCLAGVEAADVVGAVRALAGTTAVAVAS